MMMCVENEWNSRRWKNIFCRPVFGEFDFLSRIYFWKKTKRKDKNRRTKKKNSNKTRVLFLIEIDFYTTLARVWKLDETLYQALELAVGFSFNILSRSKIPLRRGGGFGKLFSCSSFVEDFGRSKSGRTTLFWENLELFIDFGNVLKVDVGLKLTFLLIVRDFLVKVVRAETVEFRWNVDGKEKSISSTVDDGWF